MNCEVSAKQRIAVHVVCVPMRDAYKCPAKRRSAVHVARDPETVRGQQAMSCNEKQQNDTHASMRPYASRMRPDASTHTGFRMRPCVPRGTHANTVRGAVKN